MTTKVETTWSISPGEIRLKVSSLERALEFYTQALGMQLIARDESEAALGVGERIWVSLVEMAGARRYPRTSGLYHFALLLPSRRHLAEALSRILTASLPVQGFADHLVSEAVYLADPDGNGIEIYSDRLRESWRDEKGDLRMGTLPLNLDSLMGELDGGSENVPAFMPAGSRIGHLHLHVAHLQEAVEFYTNILGFDLQMLYGESAAFLSVDGYHHHIGLNTWAGEGAPPPPEDSVGMEYATLVFSQTERFEAMLNRYHRAGVGVLEQEGAFFLEDPSGNRLRIVKAGEASRSLPQ